MAKRDSYNFRFREIQGLGWEVNWGDDYPTLFNRDSVKVPTLEEGYKWIEGKIEEFERGPQAYFDKLKETIYGVEKRIDQRIQTGHIEGLGLEQEEE